MQKALYLSRFRPAAQYLVDQSIAHGLSRRKEVITIRIFFNRFDFLSSMFPKYLVQPPLEKENLFRMDFNIGGLALETAHRLMNHDPGVGECKALALAACGEQERAH